MEQADEIFDEAFDQVVDLGNRISDENHKSDLWNVADGLLAGAIQYWLFSRQPCGNPRCEDCAPISTAQDRVAELLRVTQELAAESEYYHSPTDSNVGRA